MKWDSVLTAVLVACALLTTGMLIRRELLVPATSTSNPREHEAVFVEDWQLHLDKGVMLGPADAQLHILEFVDFQCPYCASYHFVLKQFRERHRSQVAVTFIHYPSTGHGFAESAARAVECALDQGHFDKMQDRLFEMQKKFGLVPWADFAKQAGVPDISRFESCIRDQDPMLRIEQGRQLGLSLHVRGTPTVVVNGWMLSLPPGDEELERMLNAVITGKPLVGRAIDNEL